MNQSLKGIVAVIATRRRLILSVFVFIIFFFCARFLLLLLHCTKLILFRSLSLLPFRLPLHQPIQCSNLYVIFRYILLACARGLRSPQRCFWICSSMTSAAIHRRGRCIRVQLAKNEKKREREREWSRVPKERTGMSHKLHWIPKPLNSTMQSLAFIPFFLTIYLACLLHIISYFYVCFVNSAVVKIFH